MSNNPDILQQMFEKPNAIRRDLPKRFYKTVAIAEGDEGWSVELDGRTIKTPAKKTLVLPNKAIAERVRDEWEGQGERIDPGSMPGTRLANTVTDAIARDPLPVLDEVPRYAETDLLFYRAPHPDVLVERQRMSWDPIVDWASRLFGTQFVLTEGVMHVDQSSAAIAAIREHVSRIVDPWTIAGLHQATTLTGSAILAIATHEGRLTADEAWRLSRLDETFNAERWGEDEEAGLVAERKRAEFRQAALFMGRP